MSFDIIGKAVAKQFQAMTATGLYRVDIEKDLLWDTYLKSFPAGTNPIYKERTEHDCNCCKSFIRTLGGVVTIKDNKLVTIWDVNVGDSFYQTVADAMAELVRGKKIDGIFLHGEPKIGVSKTVMQVPDSPEVKTWTHYFVNLPAPYYVKGDSIGTKTGAAQATHDVMLRGLLEVDLEDIDTVLELIDQNSLYRGEENKFAVSEFRKLRVAFGKVKGAQAKDLFVWANMNSVPESVSRIRNTAIGTLLQDIAKGDELETAVKAFEVKVAPTNYKRPTALVTKAMIEKARKTIDELGFTSALERRYATIDDLTINNILFANREAKKAMNVFDELSAKVPEKSKKLDKVEEVSIEDFLSKILPKAESIEVMFENKHASNLVSLIAPSDPTAKSMFKWPNNFSWSYNGEVADSIKERVKKAGGSITGDLCCRLAWDYTDDLDFHMKEPGGDHIYYGTRRRKSRCGGELDIDANGCDGIKPDPAENIFYEDKRKMREGVYTLLVNNYSRRSDGKGFEVEIEFDGQIHHISYEKAMRSGETIEVAQIMYTPRTGFQILKSLPSSQSSKTLWSIPTQAFHKVNVVMLSPNHWDEKAVGNKHYFFMLDGCLNEGKARGFFNEFLNEGLSQHRKVLEIVGAKMKTEESDRQLSGLGFSSTQRNELLCRVKGAFTRTIKITF